MQSASLTTLTNHISGVAGPTGAYAETYACGRGTEHVGDARAPAPNPSATATGPKKQSTQKSRKAKGLDRSCDTCRKAKRKCVPNPEGGPVCQRCTRLKRKCTFLIPPKKRGRPRKTAQAPKAKSSRKRSASKKKGKSSRKRSASKKKGKSSRKRPASPANMDPSDDGGDALAGMDITQQTEVDVKRQRQLEADATVASVAPGMHNREIAYCEVLFNGLNKFSSILRPHMKAEILRTSILPALRTPDRIPGVPLSVQVMTRVALSVGATAYEDSVTADFQMAVASQLADSVAEETSLEAAVCHTLLSFTFYDGAAARSRAHMMLARDTLEKLGVTIPVPEKPARSRVLWSRILGALMADVQGEMRQRMHDFPFILSALSNLLLTQMEETESVVMRSISVLFLSTMSCADVDLTDWAKTHTQFDSPAAYEELMSIVADVHPHRDMQVFDEETRDRVQTIFESRIRNRFPHPTLPFLDLEAAAHSPKIALLALAIGLDDDGHHMMQVAAEAFFRNMRLGWARSLWNFVIRGFYAIAWYALAYDEPEMVQDMLPILATMPQRLSRALYCILSCNYDLEEPTPSVSLPSSMSPIGVSASSPPSSLFPSRESSESPFPVGDGTFWSGLREVTAMASMAPIDVDPTLSTLSTLGVLDASLDTTALQPIATDALDAPHATDDAWIEDVFS